MCNSLLTGPGLPALTHAHYPLPNKAVSDLRKWEQFTSHGPWLQILQWLPSNSEESQALMQAMRDLLLFSLRPHLILPSSLTKPQLWPPCCSLSKLMYIPTPRPHLTYTFSKGSSYFKSNPQKLFRSILYFLSMVLSMFWYAIYFVCSSPLEKVSHMKAGILINFVHLVYFVHQCQQEGMAHSSCSLNKCE